MNPNLQTAYLAARMDQDRIAARAEQAWREKEALRARGARAPGLLVRAQSLIARAGRPIGRRPAAARIEAVVGRQSVPRELLDEPHPTT